MGNQNPNIETGTYTTAAQLTSANDNIIVSGTGTGGFLNPGFYAEVNAVDTNARANEQSVVTVRARIVAPHGTTVRGYRAGQRFTLTAPSYAIFRRAVEEYLRDIRDALEQLELIPVSSSPPTNNQAIPTPVKIRDSLGSLLSNPSPACRRFADSTRQMNAHLGLLHDRDDVTIVQGTQTGRSAGMLVHQQNGEVYLFNGTGSQHLSVNRNGAQFRGTEFDLGSSTLNRNHPVVNGVPMMNNPLLDIVPNGTILTPQPSLLPNFTRIASLVLTVCDMIDMAKACQRAVEIVLGDSEMTEEDLVAEARQSSFTNAYYGSSQVAAQAARQDIIVQPSAQAPSAIIDARSDAERQVAALEDRLVTEQRTLAELEARHRTEQERASGAFNTSTMTVGELADLEASITRQRELIATVQANLVRAEQEAEAALEL